MTKYTREQIAEMLKDKSTWADGWQTRDGRRVRIYAIDGGSICPVHGAIDAVSGCNAWDISTWRLDGFHRYDGDETDRDLIRRTKKYKGWVNIYPNFIYSEKELADQVASDSRVSCIEIEVEEGQGL